MHNHTQKPFQDLMLSESPPWEEVMRQTGKRLERRKLPDRQAKHDRHTERVVERILRVQVWLLQIVADAEGGRLSADLR